MEFRRFKRHNICGDYGAEAMYIFDVLYFTVCRILFKKKTEIAKDFPVYFHNFVPDCRYQQARSIFLHKKNIKNVFERNI